MIRQSQVGLLYGHVMLSIDVRMIRCAGIGTYLRQLVPRVAAALTPYPISLIGDSTHLKTLPWVAGGNYALVQCCAPIYSIREQLELPCKVPRQTSLLWSPHYNIPLCYPGRIVVTIHDTFHLAMPEFVAGWHRRAYARLMFRAIRRKASGIFCVSQFGKRQLLAFCPRGTQPVTVTLNGVDESWTHFPKDPRPHDNPYLLFVGNLKPHKNLVRLLEAIVSMGQRIPHDVVIIGRSEGLITADHEVRARASALGDRVRFVGELDHDDPLLRRYYAWADLLVLPSLYESFGLPALEAMACGCPVVLSNVGGMPEVYGDAAAYCNPLDSQDVADQILRVLTDREFRAGLIERGLQRARQLNWENTAAQTAAMIKRLLIST
ncbi:MAG: Glycosyltransferase family 1 protein [Nitrospira sp.]|nr:MAG: Glycosyltransferase family 1 protein [Nitrospira sp.]